MLSAAESAIPDSIATIIEASDRPVLDRCEHARGDMAPSLIRRAVFLALALLSCAPGSLAQDSLNPGGAPRYGRQILAPGFQPAPFTIDVVSGGDVAVKPLALGDNCLGYAAADPDFVVELSAGFKRVTFLIASTEDTTLIVNLPNGSWSCNDDTNGLNPALVYFDAAPGSYQIWIGSYAADTFDDAALYLAEAGPEALPTTATGPDPARDPLYGEITLARGFQPSPYAMQVLGGGRSDASEDLADPACRGYVSEAPDYSVYLSEDMADLWFSVYSPAAMTLLVNGADGRWHCSAGGSGRDPAISFDYALFGLYDVWIGSLEQGNYAASIFYLTEFEPGPSLSFTIDTSCPGAPSTDLQVGARALVTGSVAKVYALPETAATVIFQPAQGTGLTLVGGPYCDDGSRWWRAQLSDGNRGWIADGDSESVWLEPAN